VANILKLESISTTGSVGFLLIFAIVNYTGFKLYDKINGNRIIPLVGFILCITALAVLLQQEYSSNKTGVIVAVSVILFCFIIEYIYKKSEVK